MHGANYAYDKSNKLENGIEDEHKQSSANEDTREIWKHKLLAVVSDTLKKSTVRGCNMENHGNMISIFQISLFCVGKHTFGRQPGHCSQVP